MATGIPFDEQARKRIIVAIRGGSSLAYAAESCDFSLSTVRRHLKNDRDFAQAVADAADECDGRIQRVLHDTIIEDKNVAGMFRWLESRQPREFGQKKHVVNEHVGPGGGPVQVAIASADSLRELLGDPDYRAKMLGVIREIPMIEATATET